MSEQLFIRLRGKIQGPFTADQLQSLAKGGRFSRTHEVSTDGVNWSRAASRSDLFPPVQAEPKQLTNPPSEQPTGQEAAQAAAAPPQTDVWYYHQLGANHGPVDFNHLQYLANSGQILPEDLVWKEGLPEWISAARVPGLIKPAAGAPAVQPASVYLGSPAAQQSSAPEIPSVSGLAIASLVLGILWIGGLGSILAIIFGSVSIYQIRISRGKLTGIGLAVAGLVLGIVLLSLQIILIMREEWARDLGL